MKALYEDFLMVVFTSLFLQFLFSFNLKRETRQCKGYYYNKFSKMNHSYGPYMTESSSATQMNPTTKKNMLRLVMQPSVRTVAQKHAKRETL